MIPYLQSHAPPSIMSKPAIACYNMIMKRIEQTYVISAPAAKVWRALTDPKVINQWGGGPATMDDKEGTEFKLWGGDIYGKNTKVIQRKLLAQEWSNAGFEQPSEVRFELREQDNMTILKLIHDKVPDNRVDDISAGWKDYYLGPLKDMLDS